jgi:tetraacyldisaccharide 4'-kinase
VKRPDLRLARRGGWIELLRVPSALFGAVARSRGWLYDRRVLPSFDVGVPVISVGNLSVGGTGKTPMITWLARELEARRRRVGIVSRGYGAADGTPNDEALMLAELLPDVAHVQDRNRVDAAATLVDRGVDVILVDDGLQHRRLARDLDIVMLDALRPFGLPAPEGGGAPVRAFLPRGLMREPIGALRRADAVVITRADAAGPGVIAELRDLVTRTAPGVRVALATHSPVGLRSFEGGTPLAAGQLLGRDVELLSGVGNPAAFEATVRSLGGIVHGHRAFPDHHPFSGAELEGLGARRMVVTTAKDAARLRGSTAVSAPPNLWILDVELAIAEGRSELLALLDDLEESQAARVRASLHEGLHG